MQKSLALQRTGGIVMNLGRSHSAESPKRGFRREMDWVISPALIHASKKGRLNNKVSGAVCVL